MGLSERNMTRNSRGQRFSISYEDLVKYDGVAECQWPIPTSLKRELYEEVYFLCAATRWQRLKRWATNLWKQLRKSVYLNR